MTEKKTKALAVRESADLAPLIEDDLAYAAELAAGDTADATKLAYDNDWKSWTAYAEERELDVFPVGPGSLAAFIGHLAKAGYKVSTIRRRCAAIAYKHKTTKVDGEFYISPTEHHTVRRLLRGLARKHGAAPDKKTALTADLVRKIVSGLNLDIQTAASGEQLVRGTRDRALMLVGFITGMRRSELEYLEWEHIQFAEEGATIFIPKSKTDQSMEGQYVAIPRVEGLRDMAMCPVWALQQWEDCADAHRIDSAYVFDCSGKTINRVVQRQVAKFLGDDYVDYGAHSFRSGYVTEAHRAGGRLEDIMSQTRHVSRDVAQSYIQQTELTQNPATLGLLQRLQGDTEDE